MAEMTANQRLWFTGVFDALGKVEVVPRKGPSKDYIQMIVWVGPVKESVASRMVDFLGNGWIQNGNAFELRGYAACRGLFQELWGSLSSDTKREINARIREYKQLSNP